MIVRNIGDQADLSGTWGSHCTNDFRPTYFKGNRFSANCDPGTRQANRSPYGSHGGELFVLRGTGEMGVDDEMQQMGPGDATWIPTGSSHCLLHAGDQNLVILKVTSPNW